MDTPYDPKAELFKAFPKMKALSHRVDTTMERAEERLSRQELCGRDTSFARARLYEAEWRIKATSDHEQAFLAVERLKNALEISDPPGALVQDADGSFALGTDVWFFKLDRSTDQLLAREWPWRRKPTFLERIDDPMRMVTYLQDLCWSDVVRCGRDNRKELNLAISVIARLVFKGGQAGFLSGHGFVPAFERFVRDWQDPASGFFGMTYIIGDGEEIRLPDLSLTFHMVRYVPHLVRWWPVLIDTLFAIKNGQYPQGWFEKKKMSDHNNYDVAELFCRAWPHMRPSQRRDAGEELAGMLKWCLECSVGPSGEIANFDKGDQVPDSYYFAAAFLDTIGFFKRRKRFWTGDQLPVDPEAIRRGMIAQLGRFSSALTVVDDTLERLGARVRPWSNAIL